MFNCRRKREKRGRGSILSLFIAILAAGLTVINGCSHGFIDDLSLSPHNKPLTIKEEEAQYDKLFLSSINVSKSSPADARPPGLRELPRDSHGEINWTSAIIRGQLSPKSSLDADSVKAEELLSLNVFIKALTPMMSDVIFPHSIHTYWHSCDTCHPKIFIPLAGANQILMEEIFKGEWCGQCHGKVAFDFWPEGNCRRCHMAPKGT